MFQRKVYRLISLEVLKFSLRLSALVLTSSVLFVSLLTLVTGCSVVHHMGWSSKRLRVEQRGHHRAYRGVRRLLRRVHYSRKAPSAANSQSQTLQKQKFLVCKHAAAAAILLLIE